MRIAVLGGGPGGLYFAALVKQLDPRHEVHLWERNAPDDTFGFGVVFSDETLGGIEHADATVFARMEREFARWDDIDVHYRGTVLTSGGHGFAAMSRRRLLGILQERCAALGVHIAFRAEAPDVAALSAAYQSTAWRYIDVRRRRDIASFSRPEDALQDFDQEVKSAAMEKQLRYTALHEHGKTHIGQRLKTSGAGS